jgi:hypothetical protein
VIEMTLILPHAGQTRRKPRAVRRRFCVAERLAVVCDIAVLEYGCVPLRICWGVAGLESSFRTRQAFDVTNPAFRDRTFANAGIAGQAAVDHCALRILTAEDLSIA